MNLHRDAMEILAETSRTFYIPISRLPDGLREGVASAYLCMRAIDEIEDHPDLDNLTKAKVLQSLSFALQAIDGSQIGTSWSDGDALDWLSGGALAGLESIKTTWQEITRHKTPLPEVTLRIGDWARLAPASIAPRIWDATAAMADRMASWSGQNWKIRTESDLDRYTFSVAGSVGLVLSDLWAWYDGTQTNRVQAVGFGRGLQAVNILRNHQEDLARGVDFFPDGWADADMHNYARRNLTLADAYTASLPAGPALTFCQIPLALAHATLDALARGEQKLTRSAVMALVEQVTCQ